MDLVGVVAHLRANVPVFAGRVAGAADFATGLESTVTQKLPAAYVIPLGDEAAPNDEMNALYQGVTERIGVIVEFDNSVDRRGQTVTLQYAPIKAALFAAILNWRGTDPEHALRGFEYGGGQLLEFDRARLFYQFEFVLETVITTEDGWQDQVPYLAEIDANGDPGEPAPPFKVVFPQEPTQP